MPLRGDGKTFSGLVVDLEDGSGQSVSAAGIVRRRALSGRLQSSYNGGAYIDENESRFSVLRFGADPTGSADSSTAFQQAINAANAAQSSKAGVGFSLAIFSMPMVVVPSGVYKILNPLTGGGGIIIFGHNAILFTPDNTLTILTLDSYPGYWLQGLQFRDGYRHLYTSNSNVSEVVNNIQNCQFQNAARACIETDNASNNTSTHLWGCRISNSSTGKLIWTRSGDTFWAGATWMAFNGTDDADIAIRTEAGNFKMSHQSGGPSSALGTWLYNTGANLEIQNCRFGGEGGGMRILQNYMGPNTSSPIAPKSVTIQDCEVYASSKYGFEFFDLPNYTKIRGLRGNTLGFKLDTSIPLASRKLVGLSVYMETDWEEDKLSQVLGQHNMFDYTSDMDTVNRWITSRANRSHPHIMTADNVIGWQPDNTSDYLAGSGGVSSVTMPGPVQTTPAYTGTEYGNKLYVWGAATADNASFTHTWSNAFANLTNNAFYTLIMEVHCYNKPQVFGITLCDQLRAIPLGVGRHMISIPFPIFSPSSRAFAFTAQKIPSGSYLRMGHIRVVAGLHKFDSDQARITFLGAKPTSGRWFVGDVVINQNPAPGGYERYICTNYGTVAPAWQASHAYIVGDLVSNSDAGIKKVYKCTQAGTSAGSGGPTGYGDGSFNQTDGGVIWHYVDTLGVFKGVGLIES